MKEKIFINARIIDTSQNMDEKGSLILSLKNAAFSNCKSFDALSISFFNFFNNSTSSILSKSIS